MGLFVVCANAACMHVTPFSFATLGLADDLQFPAISGLNWKFDWWAPPAPVVAKY